MTVTAPRVAPGLGTARRLILKIGSTLLVDPATGAPRADWLASVAEDVAGLRGQGAEVIVVSSGAIAIGRRDLGLARATLRLEEMQAAAATGQARLMHAYREALSPHGIAAALVLLTLEDTEDRRRHLNARATIDTLLRLGALPVINENDTVATAEIRYGDNDRLAARVAQMTSADTLVLLSDIDGLYTADPRRHTGAKPVPLVTEITPEIAAMAGPPPAGVSSGGMVTKLEAAKIALAGGCRMVIGDGTALHPVTAIARGAQCTWFLPQAEPRTARKRWIASAVRPSGALTIDDGAARALAEGKSLLPAGVRSVDGAFERGDAVLLKSTDGRTLGRGLSAYSSEDARRILGHKSREIETLLGYRGRDEMVHRDDLVLD